MIRLAKTEDLPYVISLANKESFCLGFIPKPAYKAAITGCKTGKRSDCKKGSSLDKGGSSDYRTCTFAVGSFSGNRCSSGYCCDSDSL